jgi:outer membrane protein OmpA-like peptidoglycan-associated protein
MRFNFKQNPLSAINYRQNLISMKNYITCLILLFSLYASAQNFQDELSSEISVAQQSQEKESFTPSQIDSENESFEKAAKIQDIPHRTFENLDGVEDGYYVVIGVFSKTGKLGKQVRKFKRKGFDAGYLSNPSTKLNYLYLNRYDSWRNALEDCRTDFDGRFNKDLWILEVTRDVKDDSSITLEEIDYDTLQQSKTKNSENSIETNSVIKSIRNAPVSKLVQRADEYFNKMWYAEAAKLYEQALTKDKANYSFETLQKAGDAHYFNTNMEQAHKWYTILYDNYEKEMSADNIFKYAHSLKGTGNYGRSKRLMRLYNRKLKDESASSPALISGFQRNEAVLDNILNMPKQFEVKNLAVNSEYSEFAPMFHNEDEIVFASAMDSSFFHTRRYKWNNQPYLDLYTAKLNEESSELKNALKFSKKINTKYHEAAVTFSPDNETMYFTRNNYGKKLRRDKKGINHLKIYRSQKIDGEWTEATEVSFNSDEYSTGHPALSKDGKQLYFVSDMPGSIGETDIFVVDVLDDGSFSEPKNLGPEINTEQKEMFPFINDKKLYFSSNGHVGLGGLDVYEVAFGEEDGFLEVRNLGAPVNSNKDDFSYIVNEETQKGFFASNRAGGKGDDDIYSFKKLMIEEIPENLNAIAGVVTEMVTGDVMPRALVELLDENNIKLKEIETSEDGSFIFEDLDSNTKYTLRTVKGTYFEDTREATTKDNETVNVDVSLRKLNEMIAVEDGIRKLKTEMIHFNFDKSFIRKDAAEELDKLVSVMNEYPEMVIKIESHTDSRGSAVYNKYLSDKRAKSTRDYIIAKGIDESRIESATGYGEERLLNNCNGRIPCREEQHYLNRRSEFIIVNM